MDVSASMAKARAAYEPARTVLNRGELDDPQ